MSKGDVVELQAVGNEGENGKQEGRREGLKVGTKCGERGEAMRSRLSGEVESEARRRGELKTRRSTGRT